MYSDPIADMLTRMRNAAMARHEAVMIPFSVIKRQIASVLQQNKYVEKYEEVDEDGRKMLKLTLIPGRSIELKRISSPGQRIYRKVKDMYPTRRGYGLTILTTPQGIMSGRDAVKKGLGGEVICEVF